MTANGELPRPTDLLPHRPPFLFLDELVELDPGVRAVASWRVEGSEPFLAGHFPGRPTVPGVIQVEALAQAGACAVLAEARFSGRLPLFGGIERARFRRQVVPGDTLRLEVSMTRLSARGGKGHGVASVDGNVAAEADLLFVIVDA